MAVKVNGSTISWSSYEFGYRHTPEEPVIISTLENARKAAEHRGGKVVFRATYVTEWEETLDE